MEYDILEYLKERFADHGGVLVEISMYNPDEERDIFEWRWEKRIDELLSRMESLNADAGKLGEAVERAAEKRKGQQDE